MDIKAVKAARRDQLAGLAAVIARNGHAMLADAELLLEHQRFGRAYALAALAAEEFGKATGVMILALMPDQMRAIAPARELLKGHSSKQMGALLMTALRFGTPAGGTQQLAGMPVAEVAALLTDTTAKAQGIDRMKMRGLYADIGEDGEVWEPASITSDEAREQFVRARDTAGTAARLISPEFLALVAAPPEEVADLSAGLFGEWLASSPAASAEETADQALAAAARALEWAKTAGFLPADELPK